MEQDPGTLLRLLSALLAKFEQREARMHAAVERELAAMRQEGHQLRQQAAGIVDGARERIAEEARIAIAPAAAEYGSTLAATSAKLHNAARMVWTWYAGLVVLALLSGVIGWGVLHYYQRELGHARRELARYENAIPVLQAFHASDAVLCGGRICANVEAGGRGLGERGQYLPVKPRRQE